MPSTPYKPRSRLPASPPLGAPPSAATRADEGASDFRGYYAAGDSDARGDTETDAAASRLSYPLVFDEYAPSGHPSPAPSQRHTPRPARGGSPRAPAPAAPPRAALSPPRRRPPRVTPRGSSSQAAPPREGPPEGQAGDSGACGCGVPVAPGDRFCQECGCALETPPQLRAARREAAAAPAPELQYDAAWPPSPRQWGGEPEQAWAEAAPAGPAPGLGAACAPHPGAWEHPAPPAAPSVPLPPEPPDHTAIHERSWEEEARALRSALDEQRAHFAAELQQSREDAASLRALLCGAQQQQAQVRGQMEARGPQGAPPGWAPDGGECDGIAAAHLTAGCPRALPQEAAAAPAPPPPAAPAYARAASPAPPLPAAAPTLSPRGVPQPDAGRAEQEAAHLRESAARSALQAARDEAAGLRAELQSARESAAAAEHAARRAAAGTPARERADALRAAEAAAAAAERAAGAARQERDSAAAELAELRRRRETEEGDARQVEQRWEHRMGGAEREAGELRRRLAEAERAAGEARGAQARAEGDRERATQALEAQGAELARLREALQSAQGAARAREAEAARAAAELSDTQEQLRRAKARGQELQRDCERARAEGEAAKMQAQQWEGAKVKFETRCAELERDLRRASTELSRAQREEERAARQLRETENKCKNAELECSQLQRQLQSVRGELQMAQREQQQAMQRQAHADARAPAPRRARSPPPERPRSPPPAAPPVVQRSSPPPQPPQQQQQQQQQLQLQLQQRRGAGAQEGLQRPAAGSRWCPSRRDISTLQRVLDYYEKHPPPPGTPSDVATPPEAATPPGRRGSPRRLADPSMHEAEQCPGRGAGDEFARRLADSSPPRRLSGGSGDCPPQRGSLGGGLSGLAGYGAADRIDPPGDRGAGLTVQGAEDRLSELQQRKQLIDAELERLSRAKLRTIAERRARSDHERISQELGREISALKIQLRKHGTQGRWPK